MSDFWFFFVRTSPSYGLDDISVFLAQGHDYASLFLRSSPPQGRDNASLFLRSSFGVVSEWYRSGNGVCPLSLRYPSVRVRDKLYCQLSEINVGILFLFCNTFGMLALLRL